MPDPIIVFIPGTPAPQGSKHARPIYKGRGPAKQFTGKVAQVESSPHVKTWRSDIRDALLDPTGEREQLDGPVAVRLVFGMARPKGHYRTGRNAHLLRDNAPTAPATKPDIDKLARAVLDAIGSAGIWKDDSQVTELTAVKVYAEEGMRAGVHITITAITSPHTDRERELIGGEHGQTQRS